jgi:hypothetical protein
LQTLFLSLSYLATTSPHLHHEVSIFIASLNFQSESAPHLRNPNLEVVR